MAGDEAFPSLKELPDRPTIVDIVVPPTVGAKVLRECLDLELMNVWLQPGAESPENLVFLQERGFNYVADDCIMVQTRRRPDTPEPSSGRDSPIG